MVDPHGVPPRHAGNGVAVMQPLKERRIPDGTNAECPHCDGNRPWAIRDNRLRRSMQDWHPITTAPYGRNLQLSVIEGGEVSALVFPCRRTHRGWIDAGNGARVPVDPTHWRDWSD